MVPPVIALLTDFGQLDPFVGVMKGVMLGINPQLQLIDISHEIAPQDIRGAAFTLSLSYRYFPRQTIFLVVVDPGVGSARRPLVAETADHLFVAPDNGVLGPALELSDVRRVIHASARAYFLPSISRTFHGRDVFAPLAAWLSRGVSPSNLGSEIHDYKRFDLPRPRVLAAQVIEGEVIHLDRFGNLITNITGADLEAIGTPDDQQLLHTSIGSAAIEGLATHYAGGAPGTLGVIINSWGLCEIFARGGNAAQQIGAAVGSPVRMQYVPASTSQASSSSPTSGDLTV